MPHHITQRGNRRQPTFFDPDDYALYRNLLADCASRHGIQIWAYCLMPNHVHLLAVPDSPESLAKGLGEAHRRYTSAINRRQGWTGYLWRGRFYSAALDDAWVYHATRYVELNPVRAGLATQPGDHPWSSAAAHLRAADDGLVTVAPGLQRWPDWSEVLSAAVAEETVGTLRERTRTGPPLGNDEFIDYAERVAGRPLRPGQPGRRARPPEK